MKAVLPLGSPKEERRCGGQELQQRLRRSALTLMTLETAYRYHYSLGERFPFSAPER